MIKPRYKLVPVSSLREGDIVWSENYAHDSTISALEEEVILKNPDVKWSGKHYAWKKQTSLQKEESALFSTGRSNPGSGQIGRTLYLSHLNKPSDGGDHKPDLVPWEGIEQVEYKPAGVSEPRASVRMTMGDDIKHGELVAVRVVDVPASKTKALALPGSCNLVIDPDRYYMVVNEVTK